MKKSIFIVVGCVCMGIILILVLFISSEKLNHSQNNFVRLTPPHLIHNPKVLDLKHNSYYIAGGTKTHVYLGNFTAPAHVIVLDHNSLDSQHIVLPNPQSDSIIWSTVIVSIDSPNIYMMDRTTSSVVFGKLNRHGSKILKLKSEFAHSILPINPNSFALVTYDTTLKQNILTKERLDSPYTKPIPKALQKQIDGTFCVDGMMLYSGIDNYLTYVYYYRNKFICMDTNLNVKYIGKTIDTISRAQIKIAKISSKNAYTFSSPPLTVNERSCIYNGKLFINSGLKARNESEGTYNDYSIIDVYSLNNGIYQFSFYVPKYEGKKLQSFKIYSNTLFAVYDHYLLSYPLSID